MREYLDDSRDFIEERKDFDEVDEGDWDDEDDTFLLKISISKD